MYARRGVSSGVEHVPALDRDPVAAKLGKRDHAPHVGDHVEVVGEEVRGGDHLAQDRPRAEQLDARLLRARLSPSCSRYMPRRIPSCRPLGIGGWT